MNSKLYVGNLAYQVKEEELTDLFSAFGEVLSAKIIIDKMTGRAKGFAFVEMGSAEMAQAAIDGLDGKESLGRPLKISFAKEREPGSGGGGFRGGQGRGGGGGYQGNRDRNDSYGGGRGNGNRGGWDD